MSPTVEPKMDYDVSDRYKWSYSLGPGKDLEAILPLKKVLYDTHLQRIYEKWNGNSFKILLRDIVFLHNFFPPWTFMNVWLEGWSGSWVLIYVVPTRMCQGRHFSVKSHMHAGSWKVFQQLWTLAIKMIERKNMPASTSHCRCQRTRGQIRKYLQNFYGKQ